MAPRHVYLVRHGESTYNADSRIQGQADAPLSGAGRDQASALAPVIAQLRFAVAVTSDLARASETAVLTRVPEAEPDARWRERAMGAWTDQLEADLPADQLRAVRRGEFTPPRAETWEEIEARVGAALQELAGAAGDAVVFTH